MTTLAELAEQALNNLIDEAENRYFADECGPAESATNAFNWMRENGTSYLHANLPLLTQATLTGEHIVGVLHRFRLDCLTDAQTDDETTKEQSQAAYDAAAEIAERLGLLEMLKQRETPLPPAPRT